ncbi:MAG: HAMP domain-containing histidine kinase [Synergistaceae bacterium]|nr:HAMP domain-containing histidine kinase [Synergistaceae bacterium]
MLLFGKYLDKRLELRARVFNLLGMVGMAIGLLVGFASAIIGTGMINIALNFASSLFAAVMLYYANRSGRFHTCYLITIIAVFMIAFPVMFFASGGYHSGMPSFFVFAVVFTAFMLEGAKSFAIVAFEILLYACICLFAYFHPESVSFFESELAVATDTIIGFFVTSLAIVLTVTLVFQMYGEQQRILSEKNAALEQIDRLKTEFLGNVAHELKTPLAVMMGIAQNARQQMRESEASEKLAPEMKAIVSEAGRMALLVEQILDATRIDEGRFSFDIKESSVEEIIQTTINSYYPMLKRNDNHLIMSLSDDIPHVLADPHRISQVLVNLLQNAIRHTKRGTITISAAPAEDFVKMDVSDTGCGIAADRIPVIFERFKSHDSGNTGASRGSGTGLGLYICKHIIEAHGGEISLHSAQGRGTVVSFTIPVCP